MKSRYKVQFHDGHAWRTTTWFSEFEHAQTMATVMDHRNPCRVLDGRKCVWYRAAIV